MIVLVTNKSIMRSKLPNNAFLNFDLMKKGWSGDRIIIRNFDLMKNEKKIQSHESDLMKKLIQPPDPESSKHIKELISTLRWNEEHQKL